MACVLYNPYAVCEPSDLEKVYYWDNEYRFTKTIIAFALTHVLILFALTFRINYLAKQVKDLKQTVHNMHDELHGEPHGGSRDRRQKVIVEELRAIEK